jgi:hypothetical protein
VREQICLLLAACALLAGVSIAQKKPSVKPSLAQACGPLSDQVFKCPKFGFTYNVPFGWVERTQEMQDSNVDAEAMPDSKESDAKPNGAADSAAEKDSPGAEAAPSSGKSEILLAVFERPPQAAGETINSAVVIAAESRANYPSVKTAADYFGPIGDLAGQRGLKALSEPYTFSTGSRQVVREDFTGERGKLSMWQSSLVAIEKGQIVSFTLVAGSEDEIEELIENLKFGVSGQQKQVPHSLGDSK